ncbi:unnamed protein product, partial [Parascedosporium putredinis]
IFRT